MPELVRQFFKQRNLDTLGEIFDRHYSRLRSLASDALRHGKVPEPFYEPDEFLDSALGMLIRLVLAGRVESINGVDGFWRLYRKILARKVSAASDRHNALKRGGPGIRKRNGNGVPGTHGNGVIAGAAVRPVRPDDFDLFQSGLPPADVSAVGNEVTERLIGLLDPDHGRLVRMRLQGHTIAHMAKSLGVSPRSVNRMFETVRNTWVSSELLDGSASA
jgi:hypothetical protein